MGLGREEDKELARHLTLAVVELGMSPALGGDLRVDLAPRTTVLVGRNGAGKSAILERIATGFQNVWGIAETVPTDPGRFACELQAQGTRYRYQCIWHAGDAHDTDLEDVRTHLARIEESCSIVDPGEQVLWRVNDGRLERKDGTTSEIAPGRTLINWVHVVRGTFVSNRMASTLFEWFSSVGQVFAGVPRGDASREELTLRYPQSWRKARGRRGSPPRLQRLVYQIAHWHEKNRSQFDELIALGRRTQLFHDITVKLYLDPDGDSVPPAERRDLVSGAVDGVDFGLLSDGTLRAVEILYALVDPENKLLLIDELESAVHPGLLARLLNEIAAYSRDRQIILSTQSPQVVSAYQPEAIRLVERRDGVTTVRGLKAVTVKRMERYLHDDDTLGDLIYGGGVDEFTE